MEDNQEKQEALDKRATAAIEEGRLVAPDIRTKSQMGRACGVH
jgi:hypothetical protein